MYTSCSPTVVSRSNGILISWIPYSVICWAQTGMSIPASRSDVRDRLGLTPEDDAPSGSMLFDERTGEVKRVMRGVYHAGYVFRRI